MSTTDGIPAMTAVWQEALTADGRPYYYNVQTKATQWTKPLDLMTPVERALANQPWKEYTAEGGRKYWYNTESKQSTWEIPDVYKSALAQTQGPQASPSSGPAFVAGGVSTFSPHPVRDRDEYDRGYSDRRGYGSSGDVNSMSAAVDAQAEPEYHSLEEAENAFMKMLRRHNVQPDWSWEQTIRVVIKDPQYRALKDSKDRKAAFEKYAVEVRMQEKDRAKERFAKLRADFNTMLKRHPEIKYYSRWRTIRPIVEGEAIFRSTDDENERRQLFEEYILELRREYSDQKAMRRKDAMNELVSIMGSLNLEPYTRWSEAQAIIQSDDRIKSDDKFKTLSKSDILTVFENHIKSLERSFNDARQQQKSARVRKERHAREQFTELLKELNAQAKIKAGAKWMNIYPLIREDPRYRGILGHPGSSPLDIFWDMVEEEERSLRGPRNDVLDVLDDKHFEVTPRTNFEEFEAITRSDRRTASISSDVLRLIFERMQEKVIRRSEDERHAADRHQRRAVDALRSRIKRLDPPVRTSDTWDQIRPRVEKFDEYRAIHSDELRQSAFDRVIRRLKEKEDDIDRRHESRDHVGRRDYHDRDRDHRPYRSERRTDRRSRSPEPDAYEADRRKAQADRERSYKKASGFSPGHDRERDRERERHKERERDRNWDRDRSLRSLSHYDRERRDREEERERLYRTRGDPRGSRDELDYGADTRSVASNDRRRRRDSDSESVASRSAKRYRRDSRERIHPGISTREKESTPALDDSKVEKTVHSGSEEGEIEED